MPRKKKEESEQLDVTSVVAEVEQEVKKVEEEVVAEAKAAETELKSLVTDCEQVIETDVVPVVEKDTSVLVGVWHSVEDYAQHVALVEAIKLLQKILGIAKTGELDEQTINAWAGATQKRELIDDYNNMRKDNYKDLSVVRDKSKKSL